MRTTQLELLSVPSNPNSLLHSCFYSDYDFFHLNVLPPLVFTHLCYLYKYTDSSKITWKTDVKKSKQIPKVDFATFSMNVNGASLMLYVTFAFNLPVSVYLLLGHSFYPAFNFSCFQVQFSWILLIFRSHLPSFYNCLKITINGVNLHHKAQVLNIWLNLWQLVSFLFVWFLVLGFFWLLCTACGILVPQPGIEPETSAVKAQSPNHWTAREIP